MSDEECCPGYGVMGRCCVATLKARASGPMPSVADSKAWDEALRASGKGVAQHAADLACPNCSYRDGKRERICDACWNGGTLRDCDIAEPMSDASADSSSVPLDLNDALALTDALERNGGEDPFDLELHLEQTRMAVAVIRSLVAGQAPGPDTSEKKA